MAITQSLCATLFWTMINRDFSFLLWIPLHAISMHIFIYYILDSELSL